MPKTVEGVRGGVCGGKGLAVGVKTKSDDFAFSNNFYLSFFGKAECEREKARKKKR
jgi:hypothetical protein